jgi:rare lipoprotein A
MAARLGRYGLKSKAPPPLTALQKLSFSLRAMIGRKRRPRLPNALSKFVLLATACASLAACATPQPRLATRLPDARPRSGGGDRVPGTMKPYQVKGIWYTPRAQSDYDEVGIASWYGDQFHNRQTSDGEIFDMWIPSAAHKTLPIPCIVSVTNLDNGKTIKVRVNDRGPFVSGRIIDLSKAAATELGFLQKGTARVRVRYIGPADGRPDRQLGLTLAAAKPTGGNGRWTVQAGAFADRDNAERARRQLDGLGKADIDRIGGDGGTLYRVTVTGARDEAAADALRDQVAGLGYPGARVLKP